MNVIVREGAARGKKGAARLLVLAALLALCLQCSNEGNHAPARPTEQPPGTVFREPNEDRWAGERNRLIEILSVDIHDRLVLDAMRKVPRHLFVPETIRHLAYIDEALPIGEQQTISQPYIVGAMTELADLKGGEKVLEIGTGSGYQAAVLAEIAGLVYSVEIIPSLAKKARGLLQETLGYDNIHIRTGDGYNGWPEEAPFDAILVTAAPAEVPPPLIEQLAVGGKLVIPVGERSQELQLIQRNSEAAEDVTRESILRVRFVPMTGKAQGKADGKVEQK